MAKKRFIPPRLPVAPEAPFPDAQTAWFWFMRCQKARWDGATFASGMVQEVRPCEPDDVYRAVNRLVRRREIGRDHLGALSRFGELERPPDPRCREEVRSFQLWDEALDKLTTVLRGKDIIE